MAASHPKRKRSVMDFLSGYKTYLAAALLALCGIAEGWIGIDIPGITVDGNWLTLALSAFGLSSLRAAVGKTMPR